MKTHILTIASLLTISFGLPFTAFAHESESSGNHVFHKAGSTEIFRRGPMLSEFMLSAEQTEGRYSIVKEIFKPGMNA